MSARLRLALAALAVLPLFATAAHAAPPETYPLSQVRRGQTGYGLTTFAGGAPERFTFEVISVVTNMLPNQDIILVKSDDDKLKVSGMWRGMSGSPLFIDGKLLCAFSYGWSFNKISMGGCTPIEYMKKEGLSAVRRGGGPSTGAGTPTKPAATARAVASAADWAAFAPDGDLVAGLAALAPPRQSWLAQAPMMPKVLAPTTPGGIPGAPAEDLLTASVPLSVGGFGAPAFAELSSLFAGYGVTPVRAGGAGGGGASSGPVIGTAASGAQTISPTAFELGGSIAVQLIRGDMGAAGTGTVSYIDGNRVLAFGHPMFQAGEFYAPVATAEVHTVIASAQSAFVMASPRRELGSLVEDRQSMIMADLNLRNPMIPVDVFVTASSAAGTQTGEFHVEVLDNKNWTPQLVSAAVGNAIDYYLPDRDDVTAKVDSLIKMRGLGDIRFTDYLYAPDGAASVIGGARGLRALVPLLMNPYQAIQFDRIELRIDLRFEANYGEIDQVILPAAELPAGKRSMLTVVMTTFGDKQVTEQVAVDVPASAAGAVLQLELTAGDFARLDRTAPTDLPGLLDILRQMKAGNSWVATLYEPTEGIAIDGVHVRDLPASVADKLRPGTRTQRAVVYRPLSQTVTPASRVIVGGVPLMVKIAAAPAK